MPSNVRSVTSSESQLRFSTPKPSTAITRTEGWLFCCNSQPESKIKNVIIKTLNGDTTTHLIRPYPTLTVCDVTSDNLLWRLPMTDNFFAIAQVAHTVTLWLLVLLSVLSLAFILE